MCVDTSPGVFLNLCESSSFVYFYTQIKSTLQQLLTIEHSSCGRKNNNLSLSLYVFLVLPVFFVDYESRIFSHNC